MWRYKQTEQAMTYFSTRRVAVAIQTAVQQLLQLLLTSTISLIVVVDNLEPQIVVVFVFI